MPTDLKKSQQRDRTRAHWSSVLGSCAVPPVRLRRTPYRPPNTGDAGVVRIPARTVGGMDGLCGNVVAHGSHRVHSTMKSNAHIERYMRTMKSECLCKLIFFGEQSLRKALTEFTTHYHTERNHQGIANTIIDPDTSVGNAQGDVQCRERLGGMLRYYYRDAA